MKIESKREKEKQVVSLMIRLYCKKQHGTGNGVCAECDELQRYAVSRIDACRFMEEKTFCSNCSVHCYKPDMRERIRKVMRFSGPRMIFYHPLMAINHVMQSIKEKRKTEEPGTMRFRTFFIFLGCLCLALGTIGVVIPILPTVPFYLVTLYCFTRSSKKLHDWFVGTKLYKKHLESFVKKEGMTMRTKLTIVGSVTVVMAIGFIMMARKAIWIPCIILAIVWIAHVVYFFFFVKTIHGRKDHSR